MDLIVRLTVRPLVLLRWHGIGVAIMSLLPVVPRMVCGMRLAMIIRPVLLIIGMVRVWVPLTLAMSWVHFIRCVNLRSRLVMVPLRVLLIFPVVSLIVRMVRHRLKVLSCR